MPSSRRLTTLLLAAALAVLIFVAGAGIYRGVVDQQDRRQLQELTDHTLRRSELAVDLVVMTVANLLMTAETNCGQHTVNSLRKAAFHVGTIKDIHLVGPGMHCSGFVDIMPTQPAALTAGRQFPTTNSDITLAHLEDGEMSGLAVTWRFDKMRKFVAVLDLDALIFDVLPPDLRDVATIAIRLGDQSVIARFAQLTRDEAGADAIARFDAASARYPVSVEIAVDREKQAARHQNTSLEARLALAAIAILLGLLIARGLLPPATQLDELDRALAAGEIVPYFQPVMSLADSRIIGCEMLARWIRPDGSTVSPALFIPLAEANGRADQVMDHLLSEAGRTLGPVIRGRADFKFCFNVTPEQFLADGFVARLNARAMKCALPLHQLVVEVTERQEIGCGDTALSVTQKLNRLGIRVAIDDAGTGHNGLASIQTLGAQFLKIDKLFIDRIACDERNRKLVEMLIGVGRDYSMSVVAEGIEGAAQVEALLALGATEGQGFLYAPAVDADAFAELCRKGVIVPPAPVVEPDEAEVPLEVARVA